MFIKKAFGWIFIIVLAGAAVLLAVRAVWNGTTNASLERYLKQAAAAGIPLKFAELGPACPEDETAAPLWKAADALLDVESLRAEVKGGSPIGEWFNAGPMEEKARVAYEAAIRKNRRPIDLYLESADRHCGRDPERNAVVRDPRDLAKRLWAVRMIGVEAVLKAKIGDMKGGLEECLRGLKFVRLTLDEPGLIYALVSISSMKILIVSLDRIVDGEAIDPEALRQFFGVLSSADWRAAFRRHIQAERIFALETGDNALQSGRPALWLARPLVRSRFVKYLGVSDEMERIYGLPFTERGNAILEFDRRAENPSWIDRITQKLLPEESRVGDPTMGAPALKEATLEAMMDSARIGLAARIYRVREGRWPESSATLVPEFLEKEPLDPFSGKPYVYRVGPDGLLVYSVGANLKDEGGRGTYQITQLVMPKDDDWAWRDSFKK